MATIDPSGLIPASIQRLFAALEQEILTQVLFRDAFEGLADDLRIWKSMFHGFDDVSSSDPALKSWLNNIRDWREETKSLLQGCRAVEQGRPWSLHNISSKREISEHVNILRDELSKLMLQVPVLILRKMTFPESNHSGYLKQLIPNQLVSMDEQLQLIMERLISRAASNNQWVGIWGQGGSGKTIVAKQVNNSDHVVNWFGGRVFFLAIGREATKIAVLQDLCRLVVGRGCTDEDREEKLQSLLHTALQGKRSLLILDDVWDAGFLDLLEVVDVSEGGRIFVTTRNKDILLRKHAAVFSSGLMLEEASRKLFYNHAFGVGNDCFQESIRGCADEIISLCKGLPLALAIVGSTMAEKRRGLDQWWRAARTIKEKCLLPGCEMKGLFQYSYDQLKAVEKECFLTMLSFPEDSTIKFSDLVAWWRGEDLIGPLAEDGWEEAEEILGTLVSRSLIISNSSISKIDDMDSHDSYKLHDVILELGLEHLLKNENELKEYERGHLFFSSPSHRDRFLRCARTDVTKLKNVRKIACTGSEGAQNDMFEEQASEALLRMAEFPSLQTIVWTGIQNPGLLGALAQVARKTHSLKVFMVGIKGFHEIKLEFSSDQLQTLHVHGLLMKITLLPASIRHLKLEAGTLQLDKPQHLEHIEFIQDYFGQLRSVNLRLGFNNLSVLIFPKRRDVKVSMNHSVLRMKYFEMRDGDAEVWWPSGAQPSECRNLKRLMVGRVRGGGEWIRMLSGGCPNLKALTLKGSLRAMDSVQPPPRLPALQRLDLGHKCTEKHLIISALDAFKPRASSKSTCSLFWSQRLPRFAGRLINLPVFDIVDAVYIGRDPHSAAVAMKVEEFQAPGLPSFVSHAALTFLRQLKIGGFTVSDTQANALHQFEHLEDLWLSLKGPLPHSLIGLPGAFPKLRKLTLGCKYEEFPRIGRDSLPQLQHFWIHDDRQLDSPLTELVIVANAVEDHFKLDKLNTLFLINIRFNRLPVEVITSPSFRDLKVFGCKRLEKLVVEPEAGLKAAASSLKTLQIQGSNRMTFEGIAQVFNQMHQMGQLEIKFTGGKFMISRYSQTPCVTVVCRTQSQILVEDFS